MHGGLGRHFGSMGVALSELCTHLSCEPAGEFSATGPDAQRACDYARRVMQHYHCPGAVQIHMHEAIPGHVGLGSGTQLALAVGAAIKYLFDIEMSLRDISIELGRGSRSGIGWGAFQQGGFLLDGGRGEPAKLPPIIVRQTFPEHWRIVLLQAKSGEEGLSGTAERTAFDDLPKLPEAKAAHLCRLTLMRVLPALFEGNFEPFAQGIGELQKTVGDHFAPVQGGRFTHPAIASSLNKAEQLGFAGIGQSSWGPTGFVLTESETQAQKLSRELQLAEPDVLVHVVRACNHGHQVMTGEMAEGIPLQRQIS